MAWWSAGYDYGIHNEFLLKQKNGSGKMTESFFIALFFSKGVF